MQPQFIAIEGLEGSGKSTLMQDLIQYFTTKNIPLLSTREPGGTAFAEKIRDLLLNPDNHTADETLLPQTELLLMYGARLQHIETKIKPALQQGTWVLSDRFALSSFAYQGGGRDLPLSLLEQLHQLLLNDFWPDLTFYLDVSPQTGLERAKSRGKLDRIEQEHIDFFNRARAVFLQQAEKRSNVILIDAEAPYDDVKAQVYNHLQLHFA